jgi:hypothetical protein
VDDIEARIAALEAKEAIRQLVARYAVALDSRNVADLVALFVEDVQTHDGGVGREALAAWFDTILRPYTTTFHLLGAHVIDLLDADHATGVLYCRPEHEVGEAWVVMPMQYWDRYERRDGQWCFRSRSVHAFYAADVRDHPTAAPGRFNFPGNPLVTRADLPERWDSWRSFWQPGAAS